MRGCTGHSLANLAPPTRIILKICSKVFPIFPGCVIITAVLRINDPILMEVER
jgi:hypothetical protein